MRIGIISDLHLGFRQYGSIEREHDFYNQFYTVCSDMNKEDLDIVIIAGDLFNTPNPSPAAIHTYREGIKILNADMVFTIKGNHTMVLRDNHYSIDEFFGKNQFRHYYLLNDNSMTTVGASMNDNDIREKYKSIPNVFIDGITYRNISSLQEFVDIQKLLSDAKTLKGSYRILVVHQSFKEFCGFTGEELSIEDINYEPYDLVICGHIHSRMDTMLNNKTLFIQPGSIERMNTTEALDEQKNGKGFYIVDTDDNSCEFHRVECPRKFFLGDIKVDKNFSISDFYEKLMKNVSKLKEAPIISYKFHTYIENTEEIRNNILLKKENILIDNSGIHDETINNDIVVEITDSDLPTVEAMIKLKAKESLGEKNADFALDLYNLLKNDSEEVDVFLDNYYKENIKKELKMIEKDEDEFEELMKFFNNL